MKIYDVFAVINKIIVGVVLWMGAGLFIVIGFGFPAQYLRSPVSWVLWVTAAPLLYLLTDGVFVLVRRWVPKTWIEAVTRFTPFGWCFTWIRSGEDAIDRMLRVGAVALAFLVVFFVALRLVFGPA